MNNIQMEKAYLGDSVYAEFDGFGLILTTENGMCGDPSNTIYMEPDVYKDLFRFWDKVHRKAASDG